MNSSSDAAEMLSFFRLIDRLPTIAMIPMDIGLGYLD